MTRTCMRIAVGVFLFLGALQAQQAPTGPASSLPVSDCGPPHYCARTDRRVEPYPPKPPAPGHAGTIIIDPNFGSRILRVTDEKTDPIVGGRSMMTPSSSEQNSWNSDGTRFYVLTPGGQFVLYKFDAAKMRAQESGVLPVSWSGEPEFSYVQPNLIYGFRTWNPAFQQYDTETGKFARIEFVSDCVKLKAGENGHGVVVSANDQRFATVLGPRQDLNYVVYVFDRKLGCRWYNTQTGEIGGQWGEKGTVSFATRFGIHNVRISKSGQFIEITRGAGGDGAAVTWIWDLATTAVVPCSNQCLGHHALGYSHLVNPSEQKHPLDLLLRPLNDLKNTTQLVKELQPTPSVRYWHDLHLSWTSANQEDTTPACLSTYSGFNSDAPGTALDTVAPWENEILCVETDGKDFKVWRFAHTYSTAKGFWATPRGNVSRDGRFFMFTSDWEDQLGEGPKGARRTDVFIVELR